MDNGESAVFQQLLIKKTRPTMYILFIIIQNIFNNFQAQRYP